MLAHQLTPVMHSHRQQLINQALHAANTANAAATAVTSLDNGNIHPATAHVATTTGQDLPAHTAATAADSVIALHVPDEVLDAVPSPFADLDEGLSPTFPLGGVDMQGRRQEQSGSLPLEQMLSRMPSPMGSASGLDRHSSDELASRPSSRRPSKLGSSLDLSQLLSSASLQPAAATDSSWTGTDFGGNQACSAVSRFAEQH